jgi:hypothetical protein
VKAGFPLVANLDQPDVSATRSGPVLQAKSSNPRELFLLETEALLATEPHTTAPARYEPPLAARRRSLTMTNSLNS